MLGKYFPMPGNFDVRNFCLIPLLKTGTCRKIKEKALQKQGRKW